MNKVPQAFYYYKNLIQSHLAKGILLPRDHSLSKAIENLHDQDIPVNNFQAMADWYDQLTSLSFLLPILEVENIREVIIHSPQHLQIDQGKKTYQSQLNHLCQDDLEIAYDILALQNNKAWNLSTPFQSFKINLNDKNYRATLWHRSLTPNGISKLSLRSQAQETFPLSRFTASDETISLIQKLIHKKKNILISGSTGSGKTSFLSTLLTHTNQNEHLVILEDTHEISSKNPFTSFLIANPSLNHTLSHYCAYALRMRPDRIVLGEIRSREVVPFFMAMNSGHRGLLTTVHANSAQDALSRLALLFTIYSEGKQLDYSQALKLITHNVDYVVYLEDRKLKQIIKVLGSENETSYVESYFEDTTISTELLCKERRLKRLSIS